MPHRVCWLACLTLSLNATLAGQEDSLDQRLKQIGVQPAVAREYYSVLRTALGAGRRSDVCALVAYPLRFSNDRVDTAAECEARYDAIFTIPVRRAVGRSQFADLVVSPAGLVVGFGELTFARTADGWRIVHVIGDPAATLQPPAGKIMLACTASRQRIRVVADGAGGAALHVWRRDADAAAAPSAVLRSDPAGAARSPECALRQWSFVDEPGPASYGVSQIACAELDAIPPMGTVGQIRRVTPAGAETDWCIE